MPPAVARRFEAIVFDWDGTAVADCHADANRISRLVEEACAAGLELAVVSGTHADGLDVVGSQQPATGESFCR
jgi:phosphoglycolate phosphatase-like HAD superfamily hydrolase